MRDWLIPCAIDQFQIIDAITLGGAISEKNFPTYLPYILPDEMNNIPYIGVCGLRVYAACGGKSENIRKWFSEYIGSIALPEPRALPPLFSCFLVLHTVLLGD